MNRKEHLNTALTLQFNSAISEKSTETRIAFYTNIGFFVELAQMLEFNLRKLLCYALSVRDIGKSNLTKEAVLSVCAQYDDYYSETYSDRWTLGRLKDEAKKHLSLEADLYDTIKEINDYRILIVHKIFQSNLVTDALRSEQAVQEYMEARLLPMINRTFDLNNRIIEKIKLYRESLHKYKEQLGIKRYS